MVKEGKFRDDLLFRLKGITISLPPLRERKEDIPLLVERFASQFTVEQGLPPKLFDNTAVNVLLQHDWPGNVRQLLETVESLIVLSDSDILFADDVTKHLNLNLLTNPDSNRRLSDRLKEVERTLIIGALAETKYNVTISARLLGIDRANLHKKIKAHSIDLKTLRP
jgi:DNA-binding NtrC family response regulator